MGCTCKTDGEKERKRKDILRGKHCSGSRYPGIDICWVYRCHHFVNMGKSTCCHNNDRGHDQDPDNQHQSLYKCSPCNCIKTANNSIKRDNCRSDKKCHCLLYTSPSPRDGLL